MSVFASIIYGFISGITEILPVSSQGHQVLLRYMFGADTRIPLQEFLVHIGVLLSLLIGCGEMLKKLLREQKTLSGRYRRRKHQPVNKYSYDLRLLKSASLLLFIAMFTYFSTQRFENGLLYIMAFWLVNAVILLVADYMPRGNRDARTMSSLDGIVMGIAGALSVFPGISRTGTITAYTIARGVDNETAANWSLLLGIPALLFYALFDLVGLVTLGAGVQTTGATIGCILSGVAAFTGGYLGISLLRLILNHTGLSKFAYYSIGATMFSFAIFLIT